MAGDMQLVPVEDNYLESIPVLYALLAERPKDHGISHQEMPEFKDHERFVREHPFRYWYLLKSNGFVIGAIECLPTNEFGVHIFEAFQGKGYGKQALALFMATHEPLPGIPAVRNGHWLANVATANTRARGFFEGQGFHKIQETFQYD